MCWYYQYAAGIDIDISVSLLTCDKHYVFCRDELIKSIISIDGIEKV